MSQGLGETWNLLAQLQFSKKDLFKLEINS